MPKKTIHLPCKNCGTVFEKNIGQYNTGIKNGQTEFCCGRDCSRILRKRNSLIKNTIELECMHCKKTYTKLKSHHTAAVKKGTKNFFCSIECKHSGMDAYNTKTKDPEYRQNLRIATKARIKKDGNFDKGLDAEGNPLIIKGLSQDHLPFKVYRVQSPKQLVLARPKSEGLRGRNEDATHNSDFFIEDAPAFAAFLYIDQALYFGNALYPDNFLIVDESPVSEYNRDDSAWESKNYTDYNKSFDKMAKAIEELGDE